MKTQIQIGPKWAKQNNAPAYTPRWEGRSMKTLEQIQQESIKQTAKAVARYRKEQEELKQQAAWMLRCVKVKREPFPVAPKIIISNGRAWLWNAAPARLEFGLAEFISYAISQFLHHGKCSEEHETARVTLRLLLRK